MELTFNNNNNQKEMGLTYSPKRAISHDSDIHMHTSGWTHIHLCCSAFPHATVGAAWSIITRHRHWISSQLPVSQTPSSQHLTKHFAAAKGLSFPHLSPEQRCGGKEHGGFSPQPWQGAARVRWWCNLSKISSHTDIVCWNLTEIQLSGQDTSVLLHPF